MTDITTAPIADQITARLTEALSPTHLDVINESAMHRGHLGDDGTGHDGLPRAGRSDQEPQLVRQHRRHCFLLLRPEIEGRREVQRISGDSLIVDLDLAAGSLDESRRRVA